MLSRSALLSYSLFAAPLALVALPVYVYAPALYTGHEGLSLTEVGLALLATRLLDAFIDPMVGTWIDRARHGAGYGKFVLLSLPLLTCGFVGLFNPPQWGHALSLVWMLSCLLLVYGGFSLASIAYQSWGAALTQQRSKRALITGTREACGLIGVVAAAILPTLIGFGGLSIVFVVALLIGSWLLIRHAAEPPTVAISGSGSILLPFSNPAFRWLLPVFILNGIAAAIPATLFQFFAQDRLHLANQAGWFLGGYFLAGAASMPLWVALSRRIGEARSWLMSMLLAIVAFCWAYFLTAGSELGFGIVCLMSGLTLGADLALPPALLAGAIHRAGHSGRREGAYFGLWTWATKMNLALAAGAALPLLGYLGYVPGATGSDGLQALAGTYAVLPCFFKLAAGGILFFAPLNDL